jgi:ketosteroid isomerase-like protein
MIAIDAFAGRSISQTRDTRVPMEPEQIDELVRRGLDTYNRRDAEAGLAIWHPDCEWHPFMTAEVEGAAGYRGHEGIRQWFRDTDEMFSEVLWQVDEVRDLGDDRVLVLGWLRARGRLSGAEVNSPLAQLFEFREGKVIRGWAYLSHEQAKEAAELNPPRSGPSGSRSGSTL